MSDSEVGAVPAGGLALLGAISRQSDNQVQVIYIIWN